MWHLANPPATSVVGSEGTGPLTCSTEGCTQTISPRQLAAGRREPTFTAEADHALPLLYVSKAFPLVSVGVVFFLVIWTPTPHSAG